MGYENYYSLTLVGDMPTKLIPFCPICNAQKNGKFCTSCGASLVNMEIPMEKADIIKELLDSSKDCSYLLSVNGTPNEPGSGWNIDEDIQNFSKAYPNLVFQLDCDWDSGFGEPPSRFYFKNGVKQDANAKIVYGAPNFD